LSISSNYDYYSQIGSAQIWQRMIQNGYAQGNSNAQEAISPVGTAGQASASQKPPSPLAGLVSDGTITSEQEQAIKEALETARMAYATQAGAQNASSNATLKDPLSSLVSSGAITEEQKEAVSEALKSGMKANGMRGMPPPPPPPQQATGESGQSDMLSSLLDSLVEDGTLTEDQEESVLSALQSAFRSDSADSSGTESASADETDPLDSLVAAGTITKEQKETIKDAFEEERASHQMMPPPPPDMMQNNGSDALTGILDKLVESGAITSEQQQTISSLFQSAISAYTAQSGSGWGLQANSFEMNL
jgi:competence protein ComGC